MSEVKFEPFQRVLVRDSENEKWRADMYSHTQANIYVCVGHSWRVCIPYEGNERLLGTINSPTPPETEFRWGDKVEVKDVGNDTPWLKAIFLSDSDETYVVVRKGATCKSNWLHCRHADW